MTVMQHDLPARIDIVLAKGGAGKAERRALIGCLAVAGAELGELAWIPLSDGTPGAVMPLGIDARHCRGVGLSAIVADTANG